MVTPCRRLTGPRAEADQDGGHQRQHFKHAKSLSCVVFVDCCKPSPGSGARSPTRDSLQGWMEQQSDPGP